MVTSLVPPGGVLRSACLSSLFALAVLLQGTVPVASAEPAPRPFTDQQVCRAAIAAIMGHNPKSEAALRGPGRWRPPHHRETPRRRRRRAGPRPGRASPRGGDPRRRTTRPVARPTGGGLLDPPALLFSQWSSSQSTSRTLPRSPAQPLPNSPRARCSGAGEPGYQRDSAMDPACRVCGLQLETISTISMKSAQDSCACCQWSEIPAGDS